MYPYPPFSAPCILILVGGRLCIAGTELNKVLNLVSADCVYCTVAVLCFSNEKLGDPIVNRCWYLDLAIDCVVQTTDLSQKYEVKYKTVDCGQSHG